MALFDTFASLGWFKTHRKASEKSVAAQVNPPTTLIQIATAEGNNQPGVPRYPPIDNGIVVASPDELLASQSDLIRILRRDLGLVDADFEFRYLAPLRRAAALVNLIPATRDKHHTGAGGLFRFAATMAIRCSQSAEGRMFAARDGIEQRRQIEAAWRHAAFLTGLTCELFRPLTEMIVVDERGNEWSPYIASLTDWAHAQKVEKYFVRWHQREDSRSSGNTLASWAVNAVLGNELLSSLHKVKPAIVETIFGVASGSITTADNSTLAALVNEVRRKVIEKDNEISPITYGKLTSGSHLEPYFLDAMRTLLRNGVWQVNTKSARCHYGSDGFYVAWRLGAQEILGQLESQKIPGVPTSRQTLEEMLGRAGIIAVAPDGSWVHLIRPVGSVGTTLPAIKIQSPSAIIGTLEITAHKDTLRANSKPAPSSAPVVQKVVVEAVPPEVIGTEKSPPVVSASEAAKFSEPDDDGVIVAQAEKESSPASVAAPDALPKDKKSRAAKATTDEPGIPKVPVPRSGIPSVPDVEDDVHTFDKELLVNLGMPVCREIGLWRDAWNRGQSDDGFLKTTEGLAVSYDILGKMAIAHTVVIEALKENAYLEIIKINGKDRVLRPMPFPRKEILGIVIRKSFAIKAGFVLT
jgi:conjugal transfer pilus assembly protein TraI